MFNRKRRNSRPVYSTAPSHWGCTVLIALLVSVWPQMRMPAVVDQWGDVIARLAHVIDEARNLPQCARAEREAIESRPAVEARLAAEARLAIEARLART